MLLLGHIVICSWLELAFFAGEFNHQMTMVNRPWLTMVIIHHGYITMIRHGQMSMVNQGLLTMVDHGMLTMVDHGLLIMVITMVVHGLLTMVDHSHFSMDDHGSLTKMSKPWLTMVVYGYQTIVNHGQPWLELVLFAGALRSGLCNLVVKWVIRTDTHTHSKHKVTQTAD